LNKTIGNALLAVHRSYQPSLHPLLQQSIARSIHGLAHITGGGIEGNTMRVVPKKFRLSVDWDSWDRPAIFNLIQHVGNVPEEDMRRTFNLGVGLILIVERKNADTIITALKKKNEKPFIMGEVVLDYR
jgi:phosphoribosylformylglycinamidine cyclo-ligase